MSSSCFFPVTSSTLKSYTPGASLITSSVTKLNEFAELGPLVEHRLSLQMNLMARHIRLRDHRYLSVMIATGLQSDMSFE